ncbi:ABC transporter ATP-binding protein [Rhodobacter sp. SGA-6-6]|uniref:ABC transporter ATP-binding protein n=1 Tax=Rhodobacter sp. SGA-6-6 TaxID=2710882 RepID=UPI0013EE048F|nr:ABC transporter ATP-binding protein [Rhodobacter sp. SGA-6-6]NGM45946.1 ABC transporter ATP-binding protein [Rhodobacter sp. SGA-6-6]
MTAPALEVRDLGIVFDTRRGPVPAIEGVSFAMARGEVLGIVGESGAGKSLTGNALIGLLQAPGRISAGSIHLDGARIDDLPREAQRRLRGKRIGAIFQDPLTSLDPLMTIGDQLVETIRAHLPMTAAAAKQRALDLLAEVGIADPASRFGQYPHQFSGGMRQRIVIALAIAAEPEVIVADEPTTALDVSVQAQILALLRRLARDHGTAIMLVTHDMGVIAEIADRVAVIYAGRLVEIGPVAEVLHAARHPYTTGLMSLIPSLSRREERLPQIAGAMPRPGQWPGGCSFHPRCPKAGPRCALETPRPVATDAVRVACHLFSGGTAAAPAI